MTALHDLSATEMVAGYRAGTLSPVEVTEAVLAHIARWEPGLQALYLHRPERALGSFLNAGGESEPAGAAIPSFLLNRRQG